MIQCTIVNSVNNQQFIRNLHQVPATDEYVYVGDGITIRVQMVIHNTDDGEHTAIVVGVKTKIPYAIDLL